MKIKTSGYDIAKQNVTVMVICPACGQGLALPLPSPWSVPEGHCPCGTHVYATYDRRDGQYKAFAYQEEKE